MKISNLSTLLRPETLMRLSLRVMCLLSTKTSEEKNLVQYDVIIIENEWNTKRMKEHEVEGLLPMLQENKKNRLTRMNTIVAFGTS